MDVTKARKTVQEVISAKVTTKFDPSSTEETQKLKTISHLREQFQRVVTEFTVVDVLKRCPTMTHGDVNDMIIDHLTKNHDGGSPLATLSRAWYNLPDRARKGTVETVNHFLLDKYFSNTREREQVTASMLAKLTNKGNSQKWEPREFAEELRVTMGIMASLGTDNRMNWNQAAIHFGFGLTEQVSSGLKNRILINRQTVGKPPPSVLWNEFNFETGQEAREQFEILAALAQELFTSHGGHTASRTGVYALDEHYEEDVEEELGEGNDLLNAVGDFRGNQPPSRGNFQRRGRGSYRPRFQGGFSSRNTTQPGKSNLRQPGEEKRSSLFSADNVFSANGTDGNSFGPRMGRDGKEILCWNCQKPGHIARNCKAGPSDTVKMAKVWGDLAHIAGLFVADGIPGDYDVPADEAWTEDMLAMCNTARQFVHGMVEATQTGNPN
jgi:hypothetical protein